MVLLLALCFGAFIGGFCVWAWLIDNPVLTLKKRTHPPLRQPRDEEGRKLDRQNNGIRHELEFKLDEERTRISSELHDDVIQRLSGVRLSLLHATSIYTMSNEAILKIQNLGKDLTETIDITRRLIWGLSQAEVVGKPLVNVLAELCARFSRTSHLKIHFLSIMDEWQRPVSDFVKKEIYHIVQESVQNAVKYSNGWQISVVAQWHADHLSVSIKDNGEGLKIGSHGFGLENIKRRAKRIGANLTLGSGSPRGTIVKVELPYDLLIQEFPV